VRSAASPWTWVQDVYSLGFRLSFFEGRDPGEVLGAFGAAGAEPLTKRGAVDEFGFDRVVRVGEAGGWGFAVEEFGGDHRRQLRVLSAGGRAVSVTRVESADSSFEYVEDGVEACVFEPLFPGRRRGRDADRFLDEMRLVGLDPAGGIDLDRFSPAVAALDLVTELFGIRLDAAAVAGPLLTAEPGSD
jgi:hypothetical protein